jgi:hypothetical protein
VSLQLWIVPYVLPSHASPGTAPKPEPEIVTDAPAEAAIDETLEITSAGLTVNGVPLLASPLTVTTTFPLLAPEGTDAVMVVGPQNQMLAASPLKVTVLLPRTVPKLLPLMVTVLPGDAKGGEIPVTTGGRLTNEKLTGVLVPLEVVTVTLAVPGTLAVTTKAAVIWLGFTTFTRLTATPGTVTVAPATKFVPVIVTGMRPPSAPAFGLIEVTVGA